MRGRRCLAALLVGILLLAVIPGIVEAVENLYHMAAHGDLAHDARQEHTPFNTEHGCGTLLHLCSCCHNPIYEYDPKVELLSSRIPVTAPRAALRSPLVSGYLAVPEEPPRS